MGNHVANVNVDSSNLFNPALGSGGGQMRHAAVQRPEQELAFRAVATPFGELPPERPELGVPEPSKVMVIETILTLHDQRIEREELLVCTLRGIFDGIGVKQILDECLVVLGRHRVGSLGFTLVSIHKCQCMES